MIGNIFNNKGTWVDRKGETIVNLPQRSIQYQNAKIEVTETLLVTDRFRMRPDLVSTAAWSSQSDADLLMKFNAISNPFSIDTGMLIVVPDLDTMKNQLYQPPQQSAAPAQTPVSRPAVVNAAKRAYNDRAASPGPSVSPTPAFNAGSAPNAAVPGASEVLYKDGKVIFGPDVSSSKDCCDQPLSKSTFLSKLIKNRLNAPATTTNQQ